MSRGFYLRNVGVGLSACAWRVVPSIFVIFLFHGVPTEWAIENANHFDKANTTDVFERLERAGRRNGTAAWAEQQTSGTRQNSWIPAADVKQCRKNETTHSKDYFRPTKGKRIGRCGCKRLSFLVKLLGNYVKILGSGLKILIDS